ncbi:MAG: hypothetical protein WCJ29_00345 [bacterium]
MNFLKHNLMILIPLTICAALFGARVYQKAEQEQTLAQKEKARAEAEDKRSKNEALKDWQYAYTDHTALPQGTQVSFPAIPPLVICRPDNAGTEGCTMELMGRFSWLLSQLPEPSRGALTASIENSEVFPGLLSDADYVGAAFITEEKALPDGGMLVKPRLGVSGTALMKIPQEKGVGETLVAILHEYRHFLQWHEDCRRQGKIVSNRVDRRRILPMSEAKCAQHWENEHEAYFEGCYRAFSWGLPRNNLSDLCDKLDDPSVIAFKRALFFALGNTIGQDKQPECLPVWARLAGHPHPEAFAEYWSQRKNRNL